MDAQLGLVCSLTGRVADFHGKCNDFVLDENVKEEVITEEQSAVEVIAELPEDLKKKLRQHQDLNYAITGGLFVTVIAALLWAVITVVTGYQIGYMAIGLGLIVGLGVRFFGSGIDPVYGFIGAVYALLGCVLGNLFSQVGFISRMEGLGYFEVLSFLNLETILLIYQESFSPMDVLLYAIAAYEGYKFSFRTVPSDILQTEDLIPGFAKLRLPLVLASFVILSVAAYFFSRGVNGPKTFYYESGAVMSSGEYVNGQMNGTWKYFDEGGKPQLIASYDNGKESGTWEWFYEDGLPMRKGDYKNGLPDGLWLNYYKSGHLSDSGYYSKGRLEGESVTFYENGQISSKGAYIRDRQDGYWETFYENGNKDAEGNYLAGEFTGLWKFRNPDGSQLQEFEYHNSGDYRIINAWDKDGNLIVKNGMGEYRSYRADGTLLLQGKVEKGEKAGIWDTYFTNGQLQEQGLFENGIYKIINTWTAEGDAQVVNGEGEYITFLENTTLVFEKGQIKNGLKEGYWEMYNENPVLQQESNYLQGKLNGKSITYFPGGSICVEGSFQNDKKHGEWIWYYESGIIQSAVNYVEDKKEGTQIFRSESGRDSKEEVYENNKLISEIIL